MSFYLQIFFGEELLSSLATNRWANSSTIICILKCCKFPFAVRISQHCVNFKLQSFMTFFTLVLARLHEIQREESKNYLERRILNS